jgi:hypothetical protein
MMDFVVTDHFKKMVDSVLSESLALIEQSAQSLEQSAKSLEVEKNTESFEQNTESFKENTESFKENTESFEQNTESFEQNTEPFEQNTESFEQISPSTEQTSPSTEQSTGTFEQAIELFEQTSQSFEQTSQSFEQISQSFERTTESIEQSTESVDDTQQINPNQCNLGDDEKEDGIPLDEVQPDDVKLDQVSANPFTDPAKPLPIPDPILQVDPNVLKFGSLVEEKPNLIDPDEVKKEVNIPGTEHISNENDAKKEVKHHQEKTKSNSEESITQNGSDRPKLLNGENKTKQLKEFQHEKEDQNNSNLGILKVKTFGPTYRKFALPVAIARARLLANELNSSKSL